MIDREKLIKAIETHISTDDADGCSQCAYFDAGCMTKILEDVLALLKDEEPIRVYGEKR